MIVRKFCFCFFLAFSTVLYAQETAPDTKKETLEMFGLKSPDYLPIPPENRGENYKLPDINLHKRAMWGWNLTLPNGQGFGFGGIALWSIQESNNGLERTDDPLVHTKVLRDGKWVFIHEELRKKNPLQKHHDSLLEIQDDLQLVFGLARYIYLEGRDEKSEKKFIEEKITPTISSAVSKLKTAQTALSSIKEGNPYVIGQAKLASDKLATVITALEGLGFVTTHENISALRRARLTLGTAADSLDAEPPARVLSIPAYDAKSGLIVMFGGEHFDYLMNDIWVFDLKNEHWEQRHPTTPAPEPRANHSLTSDGQGKLTVRGGYIYQQRNPLPAGWNRHAYYYVHAGPGDWVYDLTTNTWSGPEKAESAPSGTRGYRETVHGLQFSPDYFTSGAKPNAQEHEQVLKSLPVNTWVDLKPSVKFAGNRDWGTQGYDAKRDMFYYYNGGHSAYGGTDVAHYHLATNRWDQMVEADFPLNMIGASGTSLPGWSFNKRPWMTNHTWNSYGFHPDLDRLVVAGRLTSSVFPRDMGQPDANLYLYNPDSATWKRVPSIPLSCMGVQILHVPGVGMFDWTHRKLDEKSLEWKPIEIKGPAPKAHIDHCGLIHDPKRSRMLFFSGGTYGDTNPYRGETWAMSLPSMEVTPITVEGSEHIPALTKQAVPKGSLTLREIVYHPATDLFLINSNLPGSHVLAYDPQKNRWVGLEIPGSQSKDGNFGLSVAWTYDSKRDLIYTAGTRAEVFALRIDPKTIKIKTLEEIVALFPKKSEDPEKK